MVFWTCCGGSAGEGSLVAVEHHGCREPLDVGDRVVAREEDVPGMTQGEALAWARKQWPGLGAFADTSPVDVNWRRVGYLLATPHGGDKQVVGSGHSWDVAVEMAKRAVDRWNKTSSTKKKAPPEGVPHPIAGDLFDEAP